MPDVIKRLNLRFNKHGVFLKLSGYDEINNTIYTYLNNRDEEDLLFQENVQQNSLNFYIVDSSWAGGRGVIGSNLLYVPVSNLYISNSEHEVGHCFNLFHTHEVIFGVENINGTNCSIAGDKICDTPADPNLLNKVNIFCQYNGADNDPNNGVIYQPDANNIMSYSRKNCRVRFTNEQGQKMLNTIQTTPVLQNTISSSCQLPYIIGSNVIFGNSNKTYTFNYDINYTNEVDAWSVSSNLNIISQNLSSITVGKALGAPLGSATITATINGYDVEKQITLGDLPNISNYQMQGVGNTVGVFSFDTVYVSASGNATQYEWTIVDDFNSCNGIYNGPVFPSFNNSTQATTTSPSIGINWGSCTGTFRVRCKAISSCGFKYYNDKEVTVEDEPCPPSLRISPNPAKEGVTARIAAPAPCDDVLLRSTLDGKLTYVVYDSSGNVIYKKKKAKHVEKLNTKKLNKGIYFVEVLLPNKKRLVKSLVKD